MNDDDYLQDKIEMIDDKRSEVWPLGFLSLCRGKDRCFGLGEAGECESCVIIRANDPRSSKQIIKDMLRTH